MKPDRPLDEYNCENEKRKKERHGKREGKLGQPIALNLLTYWVAVHDMEWVIVATIWYYLGLDPYCEMSEYWKYKSYFNVFWRFFDFRENFRFLGT